VSGSSSSPATSSPAVDRFIETWGTLGGLWGINRSVARIHALLIASEEPLQLDEIAKRLGVSRGNVSMSLKELVMWGAVERTNRSGDRRDLFSAPADVWAMLFKIARERKRREFDPAVNALRELLASKESAAGTKVRGRFAELERVFGTVQKILGVLLHDDVKGKSTFEFFSDLILRGS
jgi:HTH-type transcriptional regulator, glycine betaine synthesis regulator